MHIKWLSSGGTVAEVNHYYPFGGVFASTGNVQPYKYNGKELDTKKGLNWYDYGARHYDATLGRWFVVDPLAEKYYAWNPYNYCANNPVKFIDPNGRGIETAWDVFNIILGAKSFGDNISAGNYGAAVADGFGIVLDAAAALLPFIPGGVSSSIKAARAAEKAVDSAKSVDRAADTMKTTNKNARFIGEANGNIVDTNVTPKGAYIQPDGSRTDVLQDKAHYKKVGGGNVESHGRTHTHELEINVNPQTGVEHKRISNNNTHMPTYEEMKNIENGVARKIK